MKDVIIIGGGVAGLTAGIYAVRRGYDVTIIEKNVVGGQITLTSEVENYPGFTNISGYELALNMENQAKSLGVNFCSENVVSLDLEKKIVKTNDNEYKTRNIILATGQNPRTLGVESEKKFIGRGVSYCAVCDGMFYRKKKVVVVGGGNTAFHDCLHLAKLCEKVYLVNRRDEFRASKVIVDKVKSCSNIEIVTPDEISEIKGDSVVSGVLLKSGRELDVNGVFLAIGYIPNNELFKSDITLSDSGHIVCDSEMRTNIKNVYACGDIVDKNLRQLVTATSDGAIAGNSFE